MAPEGRWVTAHPRISVSKKVIVLTRSTACACSSQLFLRQSLSFHGDCVGRYPHRSSDVMNNRSAVLTFVSEPTQRLLPFP